MKSLIIKTAAVLVCAASVLTILTSCEPVSLIKPGESTTKADFDEESFNAEYGDLETLTSEKSTEPEESESETEEVTEVQTEQSTTKPESSTVTQTVSQTVETAVSSTKQAVTIITTTARTVVDQTITTKENKSDYKYGVKKIDVVSTYYDVYSDGTKEKTGTKEYTKYDYSGFSAKTSDLLDEAKSNYSKYSSQISAAANDINNIRTSAGAEKLTLDRDLCTAACVRATEMAYSGKIGSKRPSGSSCYTVLTDLGIDSKSSFELTSKGQSSASAAVSALKGTNANMTQFKNENYNKIGVGVASNPEGILYYCLIIIKQ